MLVEVNDHKGKRRFINAAFVKSVSEKGAGKCQIEVSGWATRVTVAAEAADVAAVLNRAMPSSIDAILASEEEQQQQQNTAATIAVIG